jgi:alanine dehydrogenase
MARGGGWDGVKVSKPEALPDLGDLVARKNPGCKSEKDITFYGSVARGGGLGIQFAATAKRVYELAREKGAGQELPIEWFLQDIHS